MTCMTNFLCLQVLLVCSLLHHHHSHAAFLSWHVSHKYLQFGLGNPDHHYFSLASSTSLDQSLSSSPSSSSTLTATTSTQSHQLLHGRHKWLGGAYHEPYECVYGIPSHSGHVICLSPSRHDDTHHYYDMNFLPLPPSIAAPKKDRSHQFKWLRGIVVDEKLFGIPAWFDGVLAVDIGKWRRWREDAANIDKRIVNDDRLSGELVDILPLPTDHEDDNTDGRGNNRPMRWMWHGAALNSNQTAIYCIPSNARQVLKVDLTTMSTSYLPIPSSINNDLSLTNKWYGGILGQDNAIYGIPYAAGSVLRINANDDSVSLLGDYGTNQYNWHGGILAKGSIYAFPAHAESVLRIDTSAGLQDEERLSTLPIERADYDNDGITRYKWLGGSKGADGNVVSS